MAWKFVFAGAAIWAFGWVAWSLDMLAGVFCLLFLAGFFGCLKELEELRHISNDGLFIWTRVVGHVRNIQQAGNSELLFGNGEGQFAVLLCIRCTKRVVVDQIWSISVDNRAEWKASAPI